MVISQHDIVANTEIRPYCADLQLGESGKPETQEDPDTLRIHFYRSLFSPARSRPTVRMSHAEKMGDEDKLQNEHISHCILTH